MKVRISDFMTLDQASLSKKEVIKMPLVKIKEKYQVTIPSEIREKLPLNVGDVLEAEVEGRNIVLKPKALVDKTQAWETLMTVLKEVHQQNEDLSPEEVERDVIEAIKNLRRKEYRKLHAKRRTR